MVIEEIEQALTKGGRVAARYRDQWGFITNGVILAIIGENVLIDNLHHQVKADQVLAIKFI